MHFGHVVAGHFLFPDQRHAEAVVVFSGCRLGGCFGWRCGKVRRGDARRFRIGNAFLREGRWLWLRSRRGCRTEFDEVVAPIENMVATPATDEAAAQPELVRDDTECGMAVGAAGSETWRSCHARRGERNRPREYCRQ
jgi:hypothetical protein